MKVTVQDFGEYHGIKYDEIVIEEKSKFKISFSDLGARINAWYIPNENGKYESIILGYDDAQHTFKGAEYYYGATIGRVAGRIKNGSFELKNQEYELPQNDGSHHLHGGENSIDLQKWEYSIKESEEKVDVVFQITDKDGNNGYPGTIKIEVIHTITKDNEWMVSYKAKTDAPTLFNPTNHVYFNLNGNVTNTIENHQIQLNADAYLPVDNENIPTGELENVGGSPFDLRRGPVFRDLLQTEDEQFNLHKGFDHPFLLNKTFDYQGRISVPELNRHLYFKTDEPAVVIYTQNYTPYEIKIWGNQLQKYSGLTLETQKEPDAINHSNFTPIVLEPGQVYRGRTKYWLEY